MDKDDIRQVEFDQLNMTEFFFGDWDERDGTEQEDERGGTE